MSLRLQSPSAIKLEHQAGSFSRSSRPRFTTVGLGVAALIASVPTAFAGEPALPVGISHENLPLAQDSAEAAALGVSLGVGYESLFIASGMQSAYASLQTELELSYLGFTAGVWANNPLDSQDSNSYGPFGAEYQFYANYGHALSEWASASIGFTYFSHPQKGSTPNRHREIDLNLAANAPLEPQLIYKYDFDLQQHDIALLLSHTEALDAWLPLEGLSIGIVAAFGYLNANQPESNQAPTPQDSMSYIYTEIAANLIYTHNEILSIYAGPRFAANDSDHGNIADRKANFWWGMGCRLTF